MEGAVDAGERAAREALAALTLTGRSSEST